MRSHTLYPLPCSVCTVSLMRSWVSDHPLVCVWEPAASPGALWPLEGTDGQRESSWAGSHPQNVGVSSGGLARGWMAFKCPPPRPHPQRAYRAGLLSLKTQPASYPSSSHSSCWVGASQGDHRLQTHLQECTGMNMKCVSKWADICYVETRCLPRWIWMPSLHESHWTNGILVVLFAAKTAACMPSTCQAHIHEFSAADSRKIIEARNKKKSLKKSSPMKQKERVRSLGESWDWALNLQSLILSAPPPRATSKITQQLRLAGNYREGSLSDACVGLAGTLLTDISRGTDNFTAHG